MEDDIFVEVLSGGKCVKYPLKERMFLNELVELTGLDEKKACDKLGIESPFKKYKHEPLTGCPAGEYYYANGTH